MRIFLRSVPEAACVCVWFGMCLVWSLSVYVFGVWLCLVYFFQTYRPGLPLLSCEGLSRVKQERFTSPHFYDPAHRITRAFDAPLLEPKIMLGNG